MVCDGREGACAIGNHFEQYSVEEIAMSFAHPKIFWLMLGLVPLLVCFFWWTWRRREAAINLFVQNPILKELSVGGTRSWQKARRVILLIAVAFLLLALAGPRWGFSWEEATQRGRDIIVAIDTSKSMLAQDVQPNRLERAKLAALDLLKLARYDRLGLVAFAGTAFLQCPLTLDEEAFRQSVQILEPGIIPQGGTALSEAIQTARSAFSEDEADNHKILILFTDGEDHEEQVMEEVKKVAAEGMKIFTVGVGTASGELLKIRDENGNNVFLKDESGNVVKSRLNESLLQQIATAANGFYLPLRGANAMEILYQRGLAPLPTTEKSSKLMKRLKEQYYWPLSIAMLLLILEVFAPERKFSTKKEVEKIRASTGIASLLAILVLLQLSCLGIQASPAKALKQYQNGEYKSAYDEFRRLAEKNPTDARLAFNAGTAAYQAKNFDGAIKSFQSAVASPDIHLQEQAFYNLANSEYRLGEAASNPQQKMGIWEEAIQHYDSALKMNPRDADAIYNKQLVQKRLEELKKQQQDQQQKKNQQNKDKKDNKDQKKDEQNKEDKNQQQQQKDERNKDQQKQDQESDQEKNQREKSEQEKKEEEKKQQRDQQASQEKKDEQEKSNQSKPKEGSGKESQQNPEDAEGAQYAQLGKMSPAQAKQLLDAQKGEEKAMIFVPQQKKSSPKNRSFKDW